ncbi:ATP-binding protein [Thermostaphylospora chromogena]|uniref:Anti-sigma regulatory factor (Ser/Thr protein kinase) n=1 Tax=Thermostaphylospora chromogena TaxID=35622 RepID=A0A1H1FF27_9ACTN|nr:ATP-binding protein [Thermostaphylospora chromogena]SDQ99477.1 Anti-sigma regulatory factor (Ser/Thr protein kinase) [Thermostaphylospora chromogena]
MTTARLLGSLDIPGTSVAPSLARDYLREILDPAQHAVDDAVLCVSELVTNAVTHTASGRGGKVHVSVAEYADGGVLVEVADDGADTEPVPVRLAEEMSSHGRGLFLVEQIAAAWSHRRGPSGTITWFVVRPPDRRRETAVASGVDAGAMG